MHIFADNSRFKGITLPPSGLALAVLLLLYIFIGLIGHDPWKHDDAITIGIVYDMASHGHWLLPHLAGQSYPDAPLYYWLGTGFVKAFSWLLPLHDAVRLTSGLCTLLALSLILQAARELYGKPFAAAAPLILAGSLGFLFHAHEAQPMLAALTAHTAAYWSLLLLPRRPGLATPVFAFSLTAAFLANGLLPTLTLLPAIVLTLCFSANRRRDAGLLLLGMVTAAILCAGWLWPLNHTAPDAAAAFLANELAQLSFDRPMFINLMDYLNMLPWYAWPALPLAGWALWTKRRTLTGRTLLLPLLAFLATLLMLSVLAQARSASALLLLPPLVLLAVPGVFSLRRGAANAFDWFSMVTFSLFAAVAWIAWSALVFSWPERLARQAVRLEPGFVGHFDGMAFTFALILTVAWFWLIVTSPRSPVRGIMHWMSGLTLFWILVAVLWMPWIDYGKSYRPVSASLARVLPTVRSAHQFHCIANANLPPALLASLDYFDGIQTQALESKNGRRCDLLLLRGQPRDPDFITAAGWRMIWEGHRPSDRRDHEKLRLYQRGRRAKPTAALSDIASPETADDHSGGGRILSIP